MSDSNQIAPKDAPTQSSARSGKDLPTWRKYLILFVVSWMTLCVTFSSTSLLIATPEISADLSTTSEILNVTNAGVLVAMGLSSLIWSPLSDIFGRRLVYNIAIFFLFVPSIGIALAPDMATFTALRMVTGFTGTYFMVAGQTVIADIFEPVCEAVKPGFPVIMPGLVLTYCMLTGRQRKSYWLFHGGKCCWSGHW